MKSLISDLTPRRSVTALRILYPIWAIVALFSIQYVTSTVVEDGNAAATASNLVDHELLFRAGIIANLTYAAIQIIVVLLLYVVLKKVNQNHAVLMVVFALVGVPIAMLNVLNQVAAVLAANGADYLNVFGADQLSAQTMFFLDLYEQGILIAQVFWGLWLFPLGYLVYKSGYFPRILGYLLAIAGIGYLLDTFTRFFLPNFDSYEYILAPTFLIMMMGEFLFLLWLIIMGAKIPESEALA